MIGRPHASFEALSAAHKLLYGKLIQQRRGRLPGRLASEWGDGQSPWHRVPACCWSVPSEANYGDYMGTERSQGLGRGAVLIEMYLVIAAVGTVLLPGGTKR